MTTLALLIALLINGGAVAATQEDDPIIPTMGTIAIAALNEAHPDCKSDRWDFNRDASGGVTVTAFGNCEFAGQFYRQPETGLWQFAIEGA